jgi:hypothetical protein
MSKMAKREDLENALGRAMVGVSEAAYESYIEKRWNTYGIAFFHGQILAYCDALGIPNAFCDMGIYSQQVALVRLGQ